MSAMKTLLNECDREEILRRVGTVRAESAGRWGKMSAPQMICHLTDSLRVALGEKYASADVTLIKRTLMKWTALWAPIPWPHGIKTRPEVDPQASGTQPAQFEADVQELKRFFARFCAASEFPPHSMMGPMSRSERMRWCYLHMDHHLRQFGA